jgi:hypothetical protein
VHGGGLEVRRKTGHQGFKSLPDRGVTVNKALAGSRKSATYLPTLTSSPVDHSTIRNTCLVVVERRISIRPFAQAV